MTRRSQKPVGDRRKQVIDPGARAKRCVSLSRRQVEGGAIARSISTIRFSLYCGDLGTKPISTILFSFVVKRDNYAPHFPVRSDKSSHEMAHASRLYCLVL
ncbi:MAG: hypothetical protein QNJ54_28400 [Prochloraceae cyanobacterium]|nr:hypothetical protein [Prochloraceae cyanobacterium]